jgi:serine/threonine-protein kinase
MTPERWQKIEEIFEGAAERAPRERSAFLDEMCAGDAELRQEVLSMLEHQQPTGHLISTLVQDAAKLLSQMPYVVGQETRFIPGAILAERYRIIGQLGKGGMGEVYRADDLKLGQAVALKFLPERLSKDAAMLERFHREVRTARKVSHPNVCRVFDIGEAGGQHFLSMEYIDGEDLSSLLRRIGRLPEDKATEIARQLCAGLAAAHDEGVLHRDLKPANIMIDGRGRARITDFGLAGLSDEFRGNEIRSGTPAYMSPEQLSGKEVTFRSDIYSLGLLLYEVFTGKKAFPADTLDEIIRQRETSRPASISSLVKEVDPLVERAIGRCLEKDPEKRPGSASQVAAALPGGDPLAAAVAAGETPSPEMVAAAGEKTGLRPVVAMACLAAVLACLVGLAFLSRRVSLIERIPFEHSPEVLAGKGREMIAQLGYPERPFDRAYGLDYDNDFLNYVQRDHGPDRWRWLENGPGSAVYFWYRESPNHLLLTRLPTGRHTWSADDSDPPPSLPGMRGVRLDTLGRLREFYARLPQADEAKSGEASAPDWNRPFVMAGIDPSRFTPAEALWNPESVFDARAAWTGTTAEMPDVTLRVEAAGYKGGLVFFKIIGPWTPPGPAGQSQPALTAILIFGLFFGAALLAWRNYRWGKGDRQSAFRLGVFYFVANMLFWLLTARHVPTADEVRLLSVGVSSSLFVSAMVWALYLALEPYVRRRWPTSLIAWSRVLAGKLRDPLVGRDLFIGILFGLCLTLLDKLTSLATSQPAANVGLDVLLGARFVSADFLNSTAGAVIAPLAITFLLTLLRALVRRDWLAAAIAVLIIGLPAFLGAPPPAALVNLFFVSLVVLAFIRFGLLTLSASCFIFFWLESLPLTTNLSAWYAGTSLLAMFLVTALAVLAFYTSLGGQKVFKGKLLED